ncbi:hypothetical protein [Paludisphaera soli]|uniref:hypothetical protein n=1 Tax=Paludisphaera soli TaxID=2712865 RepID=UPI0013EC2E4B|nr:hypothetical protein [Paludisphaera soli]
MKLCKLPLTVAIAAAPLLLLALASGCDSQQEIPLAKVDSPPPLPAQDKSKIKTPPGSSPSVLP